MAVVGIRTEGRKLLYQKYRTLQRLLIVARWEIESGKMQVQDIFSNLTD
jgi:hypothetical protein